MSAALGYRDPGPMARLREICAQPEAMSEIVARITDAEDPLTLKQIAAKWEVPYGKLAEWITESRERTEQYSNALRFAADSFVHEIVPLADGKLPGASQDAAMRKVQIDARKWVASKWDRNRYGDSTTLNHTGSLSLVAVLSGLPRTGRTVEAEEVTPIPFKETPEPGESCYEQQAKKIPEKSPEVPLI